MWVAGGDDLDARQWRGSIQEVESGLRLYVTGAGDIADFIELRLGENRADWHRP
jgi:hypothetical protein